MCKGTLLGRFIPIHDAFVVDTCHNQDAQTELALSPTVNNIFNVDLSYSNLPTQENVFATTGEPLGHTSVVNHEIKQL